MYEFTRNSPWKLTILKSSALNFGATITAVNSFPVSSVQFSHSVMSDSLQPHGLQHSRPPCPSPAPRVYSDSCPLIHSKCSLLSSFCMFNFKLVIFVREIEYFLPYQWIRLSQSSLIAALQSERVSLREFREERIPTIGQPWTTATPCGRSEDEVAQSCLTIWDHTDYARLPRQRDFPGFSRGSSLPRDRMQVSRIAGRCFTLWDNREGCGEPWGYWGCKARGNRLW